MSLPTVRVEVGLTGPEVGNVFVIGDPLRGRVGVDPIGGEVWTDITDYVRSWSCRVGASQANNPTRRYDPGTATIVLNDGDRRFDPTNLAGPYVAAGETQILPMVRVRIVAEWAGSAYTLFTGYADDWVADYQGNDWTYTTLTATDATKVLATENRTGAAAGGAGELSGARITRILNSVSFPLEDRIVGAGVSAMQGTTLEGNALAELQLTQDSELGEFFIDGYGRAVFQGRDQVVTSSRSLNSQATFGDGGLPDEIPYSDLQLISFDGNLANRVAITRVGGTEQVASDAASQAKYLVKSHDRSDLIMTTDAEALNYAKAILFQFKDAVRRIDKLSFLTPSPQAEDVHWPAILGRTFGDRITVFRRPAGGGDPIEADGFVRGYAHSSDGESWTCELVLQATDRVTYFTIGHPTSGRIGVNPIAF